MIETLLIAVVVAAVVAVVVAWLSVRRLSQSIKREGAVRAQEFNLTDSQGNTLAHFGLKGDGTPALILYHADGKIAAVLGIDGLMVCGKDGRDRIALGTGEKDSATLMFFDRTQKPRVGFGLASDESPELIFIDADGRQRVRLDLGPDGPAFVLSHSQTGVGVSLGVSSDGKIALRLVDTNQGGGGIMLSLNNGPGLSFSNPKGETRIWLALASDGTPRLNFGDTLGNLRATIRLAADGDPSLVFFDKGGQQRTKLP